MRPAQQIISTLILSLVSSLASAGIVNSYGGSWSAKFEIDFPDVPTPANFTATYSGDFVGDVLLGGGFGVSLIEEVPLNDFGDFVGGDIGVSTAGNVGATSLFYDSSHGAGPGAWFGSPGQRVEGSYSWDWTFGVEGSSVDFFGSLFPTTGTAEYQLIDLSTGTVVLENSVPGSGSDMATLSPGTIYRFAAETTRLRFGGGDGMSADTTFVIENLDGFVVPDPASLGLLLAGMGALSLTRRRLR